MSEPKKKRKRIKLKPKPVWKSVRDKDKLINKFQK